MTRKVTSFQMTNADQHKFDSLEAAGYGTRTDIIRIALDRMYQQEIAVSEFHPPKKFFLSMWMTPQLISIARRVFENEIHLAMTPEHKSAAEEGLACFKDAQPEYLMNLLQQNHPDRKEAFRILSEYTPFIDTPRKDT